MLSGLGSTNASVKHRVGLGQSKMLSRLADALAYPRSMRPFRLASLSVVTAIVISAAPVFADVGPPPSCPDGKTRIYDQGYKCVDGPDAQPTATATATTASTSEPQPAASATPPEDVPPSSRGCSCEVPAGSARSIGAAAFLALAAGLALRRRQR